MSVFSTHDALTGFGLELSETLVRKAAAASLLALCARLPTLGGAQYLECRLGSAGPTPLDLLLSVSRIQRSTLALPTDALRCYGAGLSAFARLLQAWRDASSRLHEAVSVVWLEFDDVERQTSAAANVCAGIVPSYVDPFAPLASEAPPEALATLAECLRVIRNEPCSASERGVLERCVYELPAGAHWIHVSAMGTRAPPVLKLYGVFPQASLCAYLKRIGWRGSLLAIQRLLERYCPIARTAHVLYVDLSVSELLSGDAASLGICFSQQQVRTSTERDPTQRALLRALYEDGLCRRDQAEALASWPRSNRSERLTHFLEQWLDLKLVHRASQRAPLAKAYLGFSVNSRRSGISFGALHTSANESGV